MKHLRILKSPLIFNRQVSISKNQFYKFLAFTLENSLFNQFSFSEVKVLVICIEYPLLKLSINLGLRLGVKRHITDQARNGGLSVSVFKQVSIALEADVVAALLGDWLYTHVHAHWTHVTRFSTLVLSLSQRLFCLLEALFLQSFLCQVVHITVVK